MARPESVALGGFFATPPSVVELVKSWVQATTSITVGDPCAGEGKALYNLRDHFPDSSTVVACEMESTRFEVLREGLAHYRDHIAHGDFFHLRWSGTCDFVWLNPPYDTDPEFRRLEERFLQRALQLVRVGGWVAFVVPYYALKASARTLADNFEELVCRRFPGEEWNAYQQVVLFARRKVCSTQFEARYPEIEAKVNLWSSDARTIPVLELLDEPRITIIAGHSRIYSLEMLGVDLGAVSREYAPWEGVASVSPPADIARHFSRAWPVASRPRAAHLAGAISAGIFNGMRITPDDPESSLPPVLIKGVFDREFRRVEDKVNKDGVKIAEVQVQQPSLVVCLLDLDTGQYHTVCRGDVSGSTIETLTMRGVLEHYGQSLMAGMLKACPVLQDDPAYPDEDIPSLVRQPFPAQMGAIQTLLKLYRKSPNQGAVVLGEIGSGKTTVALTTALAMGKKKVLVVCPPHLLDGWVGEIDAVIPSARVEILRTVTDAQRFVSASGSMVIGILSRETAKLGHRWETVKGQCPRCGHELPARNYATKRETCKFGTLVPTNEFGAWLLGVSDLLARYVPGHSIRQLVRGRYLRQAPPVPWEGLTSPIRAALRELAVIGGEVSGLSAALAWVDPSLALKLARVLAGNITVAQNILMALEDPSEFPQEGSWYGWDGFNRHHSHIHGKVDPTGYRGSYQHLDTTRGDGFPLRKEARIGSEKALRDLLDIVIQHAEFDSIRCGERLYQAKPSPRRVPLATWIRHRHPKSYDMLILDESHEYASKDAAQTKAAQRLMQTRAYVLHLTGTFMNGYAASVFMNMHGISPSFRSEFGRDDVTPFIDRYGYWKRVVQEKNDEGEVVEYGTQSDRVSRSIRKAGVAPGILPLFNLEHLLPLAVTLQKGDLKLGIPERSDEVCTVTASEELSRNFTYLKDRLMEEIRASKFMVGRSGKLWGAMARLPSYLDVAAVGNTDDGTYEIKWPANVPDVGGQTIAVVPLVSPLEPLPKEEWLLERVAEEVAAGRNSMVLTYHTRQMPRITRILKEAGHRVVALNASKVPTAKRLKWITSHVVKKRAQVLVVNPVAIQTGLNNLVHFSTAIWMENPMCNPIVFRQACGRIDRIGQTLPTRVVFPLYSGPQDAAHTLLMHKVGVSTAVDGLDPEEALRAAGLVESEYMAFTVGKQLYNMLTAA